MRHRPRAKQEKAVGVPCLVLMTEAVAGCDIEQVDAIALDDEVDDLPPVGHPIRRHPQRQESGIVDRKPGFVLRASATNSSAVRMAMAGSTREAET